jgi:hypothetical protein
MGSTNINIFDIIPVYGTHISYVGAGQSLQPQIMQQHQLAIFGRPDIQFYEVAISFNTLQIKKYI